MATPPKDAGGSTGPTGPERPAAGAAAATSFERGATRDMVSILTHRVLAIAVQELRSEETRRYVIDQLVTPLLRAFLAECMPYAILVVSVVAALLLMSALSLTLSALFYFRG